MLAASPGTVATHAVGLQERRLVGVDLRRPPPRRHPAQQRRARRPGASGRAPARRDRRRPRSGRPGALAANRRPARPEPRRRVRGRGGATASTSCRRHQRPCRHRGRAPPPRPWRATPARTESGVAAPPATTCARRRVAATRAGKLVDAVGPRDDDPRRRTRHGHRLDRPLAARCGPSMQLGELVRAAHARARTRGQRSPRRRSASADRHASPPTGGHASRGWAKTIRPATVWRTRDDGHARLRVDHVAAAALDHDHRPVVEVRDALAGLLALLDDLDLQRVAGQERRLDRVGELVEVQDADALSCATRLRL